MTLRNRDLSQSSPNATRPVRLPALSAPRTGDRGMDAWIDAINKRLDIREGAGSAFDQFVTKRDLVRFGVVTQEQVTNPSTVPAPVAPGVVISTGSGTTSISMEQFATSIKQTRLYVDLTRKIDDPSRFDDLTKRTRDALLAELAPINGQITADIRRVEEKFSNANESFAQTVDTLTAGVASAASGVREVRFASASANLATAGVVTQVQARLDNFSGGAPGTATVESKMTAIANRATGLEAQYTLKVTAGGAMAGFGLAATTNASGNATSAFIIQADKFAIVSSSYAGGLTTAPSASAIMFGVDGTGAYFKGDIRGGGNLNISGLARFEGNTSPDSVSLSAAVVANDTAGRDYGVWAKGVLVGVAGNSLAAGGIGVEGSSFSATGVAVRAVNAFGGTALKVEGPMTINNTTKVTNLNADLLDGLNSGNSSGNIPVSNGTVNTNLNADMVDGNHASAFATSSHDHSGFQSNGINIFSITRNTADNAAYSTDGGLTWTTIQLKFT
jgi:hypothetical protein